MESVATVRLPGGPFVDGRRSAEATIRPLNGADEAFLLEAGAAMPPAVRATELLARVVERLADRVPGRDEVGALSVGDREALLLHVLAQTSGPEVDCNVGCPECGERLDIELEPAALLLDPFERWEPAYRMTVERPAGGVEVEFRLPTGADQEAIAYAAAEDSAVAAEALLRRCLLEVEPPPPNGKLDPEIVEAVGERMAELDPQAVVELAATCPRCEAAVLAPLDALDFLCRDLEAHRGELLVEVDALARAYHWSEQEILGLPRRRRREYAALARGAEVPA